MKGVRAKKGKTAVESEDSAEEAPEPTKIAKTKPTAAVKKGKAADKEPAPAVVSARPGRPKKVVLYTEDDEEPAKPVAPKKGRGAKKAETVEETPLEEAEEMEVGDENMENSAKNTPVAPKEVKRPARGKKEAADKEPEDAKPAKGGRKKVAQVEEVLTEDIEIAAEEPEPVKRGRKKAVPAEKSDEKPAKKGKQVVISEVPADEIPDTESLEDPEEIQLPKRAGAKKTAAKDVSEPKVAVKRGRGRPPKVETEPEVEEDDDMEEKMASPKKGRGRKAASVEPVAKKPGRKGKMTVAETIKEIMDEDELAEETEEAPTEQSPVKPGRKRQAPVASEQKPKGRKPQTKVQKMDVVKEQELMESDHEEQEELEMSEVKQIVEEPEEPVAEVVEEPPKTGRKPRQTPASATKQKPKGRGAKAQKMEQIPEPEVDMMDDEEEKQVESAKEESADEMMEEPVEEESEKLEKEEPVKPGRRQTASAKKTKVATLTKKEKMKEIEEEQVENLDEPEGMDEEPAVESPKTNRKRQNGSVVPSSDKKAKNKKGSAKKAKMEALVEEQDENAEEDQIPEDPANIDLPNENVNDGTFTISKSPEPEVTDNRKVARKLALPAITNTFDSDSDTAPKKRKGRPAKLVKEVLKPLQDDSEVTTEDTDADENVKKPLGKAKQQRKKKAVV